MSIADLYNLLEKMQNTIGCDCRVYAYISGFQALELKAEWITKEEIITYVRAYHPQELRYIRDLDFVTDWFCGMAKREHKLRTVGEE